IQADVKDTNYVIADHTGITITGATITKSFKLDEVTIDGSLTVGYDKPSSTFTLGGDVTVTTQAQGTNSTVALNSVAFGLNAPIVDGDLTAFGFEASGSFTIFGLTVKVAGGSNQPFAFQYDTAQKQFELSGGLELDFNTNKIIADFGTLSAPG